MKAENEFPKYNFKNSLLNKTVALTVVSIISIISILVVQHYIYILDSYLYTAEFNYLFITNNLEKGNLEKFTEYLSHMQTKKRAFPMVFVSHLAQNFILPFSKQILIPATISVFGFFKGSLMSYASFLLIGLLSFGLSIFFFGDVFPYIENKKNKTYSAYISNSKIRMLFPVLFGIPFVPVSITSMLGGITRLSFRKISVYLFFGSAIRLSLLIVIPGFFLR